MKLELIVHCWRYAKVLTYQLSSLVLHPPSTWDNVQMTVFCSPEDKLTIRTLNYFQKEHGVNIVAYLQTKPDLFRREIGRNKAAIRTTADVVWFLDADYVFGPGCLEWLQRQACGFQCDRIYFPMSYLWNRTKELGDDHVAFVTEPNVYEINPEQFEFTKCTRAIGGLQIVTGDTARKHGYCPDTDRQRPTGGQKWAVRTIGDKIYRQIIGGPGYRGHKIDLPNLFRIRQTQGTVVDTLEV